MAKTVRVATRIPRQVIREGVKNPQKRQIMGKRGPSPTPTPIKLIQGTYRPDRDSGADFAFSDKLPTCPRFLSKAARDEWRRVARELHSVGLLKTVDRAALAAYCDSFGRWVDIVEQLDQVMKSGELVLVTSKGYRYQNPLFSMAASAKAEMIRMGALFGLNPSARTRIHLPDASANQPSLFDEINAMMEQAAERAGSDPFLPGKQSSVVRGRAAV